MSQPIKEKDRSLSDLSQIIHGMAIPAFVIDRRHIVTHWNRACEKLTGVPAADVIGTQDAWKAFYPEKRPVLADLAIGGDCADTILHVPGGTAPWVRTRPQQQFVNKAHIHEPWMWAGKGEQSLTLLSPDGYPGAVVAVDLQVMVLGLPVVQVETAPRENTAVEFALAVNQPQSKTTELIKALGREM